MRTAAFVTALIGCARPPGVEPAAAPVPADAERHFTIWLGGARVGTAVETEAWSSDGVLFRRVETLHFLRGNADVRLATTIEVSADRTLDPVRVSWIERGPATAHGEATRDARGWVIATDRGEMLLRGDAIPAELAPLITRRDGKLASRVFLPARGFVAGDGRIDPVAPDRLVARLAFDGGALAEATIDVDRDGTYTRVVDGEGVIALRVSADGAAEPFAPVDLIAATAIPVTGTGEHLVLDGDIALPSVPGQSAHLVRDGVELALSPKLPGALPAEAPSRDRTYEITTLVRAVRARIQPDLGTGPTSAQAAAAATAGDCTTFALAYAALASQRAIPTRVVTGLRLDGARLVRHRWAVSWTGRAWIAVDAAFGAAPAGGDLVGLALHGADDAGLVAGEAALARVRAASRR